MSVIARVDYFRKKTARQ